MTRNSIEDKVLNIYERKIMTKPSLVSTGVSNSNQMIPGAIERVASVTHNRDTTI